MIRLFLVDDHAIVRDGLRALLHKEAAIDLVGEAANGQELLDQLPTTPTDVVLLDMNMPVLDGVATARRLQAEYPQVRVLMLSMIDQARHIGLALEAGAHGYVLKNADKGEILVAIHTVAAGKRFLCSEIGLALLDQVLGTEPAPTSGAANNTSTLSRRELEILQLLAEGLTTQQMADQLFVSKRTVETHRQNILEKTASKNTAALVRYAMTQGYLRDESAPVA
jgi:DNA-binding NarL/FixJ family response regulator